MLPEELTSVWHTGVCVTVQGVALPLCWGQNPERLSQMCL